MQAKAVTGSCLCGKISFQLSPPFPASAHCHCTYCQKAHGSAFVTWVVGEKASFRLLTGEAAVQWYQSSEQSRRGFCNVCGSTLFFESALCPTEIHITRANLTEEFPVLPMFHCFTEQKVKWITVADDLPHLNGESPELAHYKTIEPLRCE